MPVQIPHTDLQHSYIAAAATLDATDKFHLDFSDNPFENKLEITILNTGDQPTHGLDIQFNKEYNRVQLIACEKGTPAGKINKWRLTLQNGIILTADTVPVTTIAQLW
jgi:methionine-rich copper-binding protein CopC